MTKEEFIKNLYLRKDDLMFDDVFQTYVLKDLIKIGFEYVNAHYPQAQNKFPNMMLQMSLLKANSILQLSNGIDFLPVPDDSRPLVDIQSQSNIFRSLFENYCFFNHLYIRKWSEEEFLILENIWKIASLNQRFDLVDKSVLLTQKDNKSKIENEKEFVRKLINEIESTTIYKTNRKTINSKIKKNLWQLTIVNNRVIYISWKEMFKNSMKNKPSENKIYQSLSLDNHPSYFSVFQFGDMYKSRHDLDRKTLILYQTIDIICCYLNDFENLLSSKITIESDTKYLIEILGKNDLSTI